MRDRAFGVEIEFNTNGYGEYWIRKELRRNRIDWRIGHDGSELELKTPILQGTKGFKELKTVMNFLKESGCKANSYDGLHIHHDAPDFIRDEEAVLRLVKSWHENRNIVNSFVSQSRRRNSHCPHWEIEDIHRLEEGLYNGYGGIKSFGRNSLNVLSLEEHGTIEIRLHEGTLDYDQAEAWIKFGQKFINSCASRKRHIPELTERDLLLRRIRVAKRTQKTLEEKALEIRR